jgi:lipopolysaccharide export system protein LptC
MATVALSPIDPAADAQRLQAAMRRWRRRSHLIHFFRKALPAAMALMVLGLVGWVGWRAITNPTPVENATVSIRMVNPRFRGRDDNGRAFVMSASEAARDSRDFQRVLLKNPAVELQNEGAPPFKVRARTGVYNERTFVILLEGAVVVEDPSGWVFHTERAVVETMRNVISGDLPVRGVGPMGSIAGSSYVIYNNGERIILRGGVRTTLTQ